MNRATIDRKLAQEGRGAELDKMRSHGVFEVVPLEKLCGKKIGTRWVEEIRTNPGGTQFARCRLVGKEIAYHARDDASAGTPPLCVVRLLISSVASWCGRGCAKLIALHVAEVAFFHDWLHEWICVPKLPAGTVPAGYGWQLRQALYRTRRASQVWAEYIAAAFATAVWSRSKITPGVYFRFKPGLVCIAHGDDFATVGAAEDCDHADDVLKGSVQIKMLGRVGPGGMAKGR